MRFIISIFFFAFTFTLVSAQTQISIPKFELGAIGGLNFSNVVKLDENDNNGIRLGIHLGGYAQFELPFHDKLGFRPELHFISIKGTSSGGYKSYYLDFPLLATFDLDDSFTLMAGPQPSLLLYASTDEEGELTSLIRTIDIGFVFAGWYQIDQEWGVGARITPGLSRVGANGENRDYNVNFQLSVGYRFM